VVLWRHDSTEANPPIPWWSSLISSSVNRAIVRFRFSLSLLLWMEEQAEERSRLVTREFHAHN
jgi:hypothetical protein